MAEQGKAILKQALPILVSASIAAGLAFTQSVASHAGICPALPMQPATVGLIGGMVKAAHSLLSGLTNNAAA